MKKNMNHPLYNNIKMIYDKCKIQLEDNEITAKYQRLDNPKFSPVFGEFHSLCPIYFTVAQQEILLDDTLKCIQKCRQANVEVEVEIHPYCLHAYPGFPFFPEAIESNARIELFIGKYVK